MFNAIKVHPAVKKYCQYYEICKNNIYKQYNTHFTKSGAACVTELGERERNYKAL
jgi:hypothetical protein